MFWECAFHLYIGPAHKWILLEGEAEYEGGLKPQTGDVGLFVYEIEAFYI